MIKEMKAFIPPIASEKALNLMAFSEFIKIGMGGTSNLVIGNRRNKYGKIQCNWFESCLHFPLSSRNAENAKMPVEKEIMTRRE